MASDVFRTSGRLILRALIKGKATIQEMAGLAKGRLRNKIPELELALESGLEPHHRFLLELQVRRLESAEKDLATLEQRIQETPEPYAAQLALLDEIHGVDQALAAVIIAELGVDICVFPSVSQMASWAGVWPRKQTRRVARTRAAVSRKTMYT